MASVSIGDYTLQVPNPQIANSDPLSYCLLFKFAGFQEIEVCESSTMATGAGHNSVKVKKFIPMVITEQGLQVSPSFTKMHQRGLRQATMLSAIIGITTASSVARSANSKQAMPSCSGSDGELECETSDSKVVHDGVEQVSIEPSPSSERPANRVGSDPGPEKIAYLPMALTQVGVRRTKQMPLILVRGGCAGFAFFSVGVLFGLILRGLPLMLYILGSNYSLALQVNSMLLGCAFPTPKELQVSSVDM
ncbi:hypothetical protein FA15DRAFT_708049 [Coprinopsis marcescibilis]|uniref:Uncharacterized protein n=1 Tax=Coprinopsis marcescibilis TaxID=230819 RepID=A0A5C3KK32_COPMA|nr:hypothetical protein FA15DRAFT_708049 [Coprinopsis marcescibilis]